MSLRIGESPNVHLTNPSKSSWFNFKGWLKTATVVIGLSLLAFSSAQAAPIKPCIAGEIDEKFGTIYRYNFNACNSLELRYLQMHPDWHSIIGVAAHCPGGTVVESGDRYYCDLTPLHEVSTDVTINTGLPNQAASLVKDLRKSIKFVIS